MKKLIIYLILVIISFTPITVFSIIDDVEAQPASTSLSFRSGYIVTLPDSIALSETINDYKGTYNIRVTGNLKGDEILSIIPNSKITLSSVGKTDIFATVNQLKTKIKPTELNTSPITATGTISTNIKPSAGLWDGSFHFNISLIKRNYIEVSLTADNYNWVGVKREGKIVIPDFFENEGLLYKVTSIASRAFENCENLTNVTMPDTITAIGEWAFASCKNLAEINIPDSVTKIEEAAFTSCRNLAEVIIPNNLTIIEDSVFNCCAKLKTIIIPSSVKIIGRWAFSDCHSLTDAIIPGSTTEIRAWAFSYCRNMTNLKIPNTVQSIGADAFIQVPHIIYYGPSSGKPWGAYSIN